MIWEKQFSLLVRVQGFRTARVKCGNFLSALNVHFDAPAQTRSANPIKVVARRLANTFLDVIGPSAYCDSRTSVVEYERCHANTARHLRVIGSLRRVE
jgi:hypothetical protein